VRLLEKNNQTVAQLFQNQGSGVLSSASWADGLVEVKIGQQITQGDAVIYLPLEGLY
jgi:molybdopterin molybdotransferase